MRPPTDTPLRASFTLAVVFRLRSFEEIDCLAGRVGPVVAVGIGVDARVAEPLELLHADVHQLVFRFGHVNASIRKRGRPSWEGRPRACRSLQEAKSFLAYLRDRQLIDPRRGLDLHDVSGPVANERFADGGFNGYLAVEGRDLGRADDLVLSPALRAISNVDRRAEPDDALLNHALVGDHGPVRVRFSISDILASRRANSFLASSYSAFSSTPPESWGLGDLRGNLWTARILKVRQLIFELLHALRGEVLRVSVHGGVRAERSAKILR